MATELTLRRARYAVKSHPQALTTKSLYSHYLCSSGYLAKKRSNTSVILFLLSDKSPCLFRTACQTNILFLNIRGSHLPSTTINPISNIRYSVSCSRFWLSQIEYSFRTKHLASNENIRNSKTDQTVRILEILT